MPRGQGGRIFVANEMVFGGYTGGGNKEIVNGRMSSGDVGHFDAAGRLFVDGRDDEMIVCGGENVFPQEIEELLADHADVAEAAVIGVADDEFGQRRAHSWCRATAPSSARSRSGPTSSRTSRATRCRVM